MNKLPHSRPAFFFIVGLAPLVFGLATLHAQTTRTAAERDAETKKSPLTEEVLVLNPFVVTADEDQGSYKATATLAGTRIRTDLKDIASSISVVTQQFLQDTGSKNSQDLLVYTPNTEVGGLSGNFAGNANGGQTYSESGALASPHTNTRARGLDAMDNTRDYFLTDIPWDGFNVGRIDIQRGPNSILFGVGSPSGIINNSVNTAGFKTRGNVESVVDGHGSFRESVDFNYVLLPNELSIRVAALEDKKKFEQKPAFNNSSRYYAAFRYEPNLLGSGNHTSLRANFESGKVRSDNPRSLPPVDAITPWFLTGTTPGGRPNLNKQLFNPALNDTIGQDLKELPWFGTRMGRQDWADTVAWYGNDQSSTPSFYMSPMANQHFAITTTGSLQATPSFAYPVIKPFMIVGYSQYGSQRPGALSAGVPGGRYAVDRSLNDPSIYNFYTNLIDGKNKSEWQNWTAYNLSAEQTLFGGRLGFEFVYDYQRYDNGQIGFLGSSGTYTLSVDVNSSLPNGAPNPNAGRPFVANSTQGGNNDSVTERRGIRFTATAELRAEDFLEKGSLLTRILGTQNFTGLFSEDKKYNFSRSWAQSASTPDYGVLIQGQTTGPQIDSNLRAYDWVAYLGPTLLNASSPAGAHIDRINTTIAAPKTLTTTYFDSHWNKPLASSQLGYVDPSAAFDYTIDTTGIYHYNVYDPTIGTAVHSTQNRNPANYVGWTNTNLNFLSADRGDISALYTGASKQRVAIKSKAITWQGHLLDDIFVPTLGWRRDEVTNMAAQGPKDSLNVVSTDFGVDPTTGSSAGGESKSWGGVLRLPRKFLEKQPWISDVSVFFDHSSNFKADSPRGDIQGNQLPNAKGITKEYGFAVSALHDKLTLKVTRYETAVTNATLGAAAGAGFGGNLFWLDDAIPVWGTTYAAFAYQYTTPGQPGYGDPALVSNGNYVTGGKDPGTGPNAAIPGNPAFDTSPIAIREMAALKAWGTTSPFTQAFFDAYGFTADRFNWNAVSSGNISGYINPWSPGARTDLQGPHQIVRFNSAPVATVDTLSKGTEIELVAQPIKEWNISVNASKTFATYTSISRTVVDFMAKYAAWMNGPAGDLSIFGAGGLGGLRGNFNSFLLGPYTLLQQQLGHQTPELAPWRFNAFTSYSFSHDNLKGAFIGGGYRWEEGRVLGYQFDPTINPNVGGNLDITKPWKGSSDSHFDLVLGYDRKLNRKINWRVQLNLRNVGEKDHLVPISVQPDGSPGFARIADGMSWRLTNSFDF